MSILIPPPLKPGARVALVALSRRASEEHVSHARRVLTAWGLTVVPANNLLSQAHAYLAGTDDQRLADLQAALDDPTIDAILCARGGYGSGRIIDRANYATLQQHPKWIVGFSDVTALQLKLLSLGIASIHGTMPVLFANPASIPSIESLRNALFGKPDAITAPAAPANKPGRAEGVLVGGNLSLLVDSLGTASELDTNGKILVIEEIGELVYRVDRMVNQLKRAGKLANLAGLLIGHMTDIKEDPSLAFEETPEQIILNHTRAYHYPVAFRFPSGHENPNLAWVQGARVSLEVTAAQSIITPLV
ncbi:S66 peptidase family protein [Dawidia soli]|uniref:LD-carboxypeptidase n=1 Tax=Dawidia soli TaxID=2782352 RepID=A0AAP2GGC4_9BACT|nr:LD-carboxypeptidase [Dawidia soli]MBT1685370.1 LD-carboxypeptidase [Dawidia soli]